MTSDRNSPFFSSFVRLIAIKYAHFEKFDSNVSLFPSFFAANWSNMRTLCVPGDSNASLSLSSLLSR